jgi:hypothetical protein
MENRSNGMATAGFVFALLNLFLGWLPILGWIFWILGLVFSIIGYNDANNKDGVGKGLALAGIIISLLGFVFLTLVFGLLAAFFAAFFGFSSAIL